MHTYISPRVGVVPAVGSPKMPKEDHDGLAFGTNDVGHRSLSAAGIGQHKRTKRGRRNELSVDLSSLKTASTLALRSFGSGEGRRRVIARASKERTVAISRLSPPLGKENMRSNEDPPCEVRTAVCACGHMCVPCDELPPGYVRSYCR
eukprot:1178151-Prorocentrum_minimum.AAC.4